MSVELTISAGQLLLKKDGRTVFNSNDKFLHGVASGFPISGSRTINSINGGPSRIDQTNVFDLGAVTPGHTQLIGAVRMSAADGVPFPAALAFDRWTMLMGGSVLWVIDGEPGGADRGQNVMPYQWIDYSFRIRNNRAEMVQRVLIAQSDILYRVRAHVVTYKLRSGNWT